MEGQDWPRMNGIDESLSPAARVGARRNETVRFFDGEWTCPRRTRRWAGNGIELRQTTDTAADESEVDRDVRVQGPVEQPGRKAVAARKRKPLQVGSGHLHIRHLPPGPLLELLKHGALG